LNKIVTVTYVVEVIEKDDAWIEENVFVADLDLGIGLADMTDLEIEVVE